MKIPNLLRDIRGEETVVSVNADLVVEDREATELTAIVLILIVRSFRRSRLGNLHHLESAVVDALISKLAPVDLVDDAAPQHDVDVIGLSLSVMMTARHDLLDGGIELDLSHNGSLVEHSELLVSGSVLHQILVLLIHDGVGVNLLVVTELLAELTADGGDNLAGSPGVELDDIEVPGSLLLVESSVSVHRVVGSAGCEVPLPEVGGGVTQALTSLGGVDIDLVLVLVGDDVDVPLPLGNAGLLDDLPLLIDGEEVPLLISSVEDLVVGVVLLLAGHGNDGVVRDLAVEGVVTVADVDDGESPVILSNQVEPLVHGDGGNVPVVVVVGKSLKFGTHADGFLGCFLVSLQVLDSARNDFRRPAQGFYTLHYQNVIKNTTGRNTP